MTIIKVRNNVFETNSSSCHSVSIADETKQFILDTILPDENGNIILNGGEFGWEWFRANDALTKANYAAVDCSSDILIEVIKEQTGCENVIFNFSEEYNHENWSYIDHDSVGTAPRDKEGLRNFIFNKNSWLFGGNDNSSAEPDFYIVPEYTSDGVIEPAFKYKLTIWENTTRFMEYPTDEDLENILDNLSVRYNGTFDRLEKHWYWTGNEVFYEKNWNYKQSIDKGFAVLINEKVADKLLEGKNWHERTEILKAFIDENIDNPDVVYKLPFKIETL